MGPAIDVGDQEWPPAQEIGVGGAPSPPVARPEMSGAPGWRTLAAVGLAIAALVGVYALGRSGAQAPEVQQAAAPDAAGLTALPTATAIPTASPEPEPPVQFVDLLGEGSVLADFDLGNSSRAVLWCRESVPGTQIASTLALVHLVSTIRFGEQVVLYEELTTPRVAFGSGRRGNVLATEGLGTASSDFSAPDDEDGGDDEPDLEEGQSCESCRPEQITLGGGDVLLGHCVHGVPFGVGVVYVIAPAVRTGQTPLALHLSCGITSTKIVNDQLVISGEAPLVRALHQAVYPFPEITFERTDGRFVASDLELLDWNCDVSRSSHLENRHLLRTDPTRTISYETVDSVIGEIGVHGPMVLGLTPNQCSQMTRAWWGRVGQDDSSETPIADLVGLEPPAGEDDWFYSCRD